MTESEPDLWRQFYFDLNISPRGGILTCLRCTLQEIETFHASVVSDIQNLGVTFEEVDGGIAAVPESPLSPDDKEKLLVLLQQLTMQNEALDYTAVGYGAFRTISELRNGLMIEVSNLMSQVQLAEAYDLADRVIPQIVRDTRITDSREHLLSPQEQLDLDSLSKFAGIKVRQLNRRSVMIG